VLLVLIPALEILFGSASPNGSARSSSRAHHPHRLAWMTERADRLSQYQFQWPAITATLMVSAIRWMMVIVVLRV